MRLFPENRHDFGMVPRGVKVKHDFLLVNRLAEPITILNLRPSCGCTSGRTNTPTVAPGQTAVIEAEMDTRNFVGPKSTVLYVSVITASGREGETGLGVSSHILSDIVLNPGSVNFGTVTRGQSPTQVLTIDRINAPGWKFVRMVSACRAIDAQLAETSRTAKSASYTLTVSILLPFLFSSTLFTFSSSLILLFYSHQIFHVDLLTHLLLLSRATSAIAALRYCCLLLPLPAVAIFASAGVSRVSGVFALAFSGFFGSGRLSFRSVCCWRWLFDLLKFLTPYDFCFV